MLTEKEQNHYWNEIYIQMLHASVTSPLTWTIDGEPICTLEAHTAQAGRWADAAVKNLKPV